MARRRTTPRRALWKPAKEDFATAADDAVAQGADLVITVGPTQMDQALKAAVKHPDVAFANCAGSTLLRESCWGSGTRCNRNGRRAWRMTRLRG